MKNLLRNMAVFFLAGLLCNCARTPSSSDLRQQLLELHSLAEKGNADQAVNAGEKALKMMDIEDIRDSDTLTNEGEDNFTFEAFDESLRIFEMAHLKNPNNDRANSYLAFLTPLSHLKGINWRLADDDGDDQIGLEILRSYRSSPNDSNRPI